MPYLSADDIYRKILPEELNVEGGIAESLRLIDHFQSLPAIIATLDEKVHAMRKPHGSLKKALADFNDNLIRVAIRMVNNDQKNCVIAGAGLKIAAIATERGADGKWAEEKVYQRYDSLCGRRVEDLVKEELEAAADGEENDNSAAYHLIVSDLFMAAALVPLTSTHDKIHDRAKEGLLTVANNSLGEYNRFLRLFEPFCRDEKTYPGAISIVEETYASILSEQKTFFAGSKKSRSKATRQLVSDIANLSLSLDAALIVRFQDVPQISQLAVNAFCEHYRVIKTSPSPAAGKGASPSAAEAVLQKLHDLYEQTKEPDDPLAKGRAKLLVLVEYFQNATNLTKPKDFFPALFNEPPTPKTRPNELLN